MPKLHPLDLPEIRNHLALFLPRHELTVCARLSQEWYNALLPFIWSELRIMPAGSFGSKIISPLVFARDSSCIQRLDYLGKSKPYLGSLNCPKLKYLTLQLHDPYVIDFIRRHRTTLRSLTFSVLKDLAGSEQYNHEFWEVVKSCPLLETLYVSGTHITQQDLPQCWSLWSQLTTLKLSNIDFLLPGLYESSGAVATRIKDLELAWIGGSIPLESQLEVLKWCPELVSLVWRNLSSRGSDRRSIRKLLPAYTRHCPKLVKLSVEVKPTAADDGILPFLESRTDVPMEKLSLKKNWFGETAWSHIQQSHHRYSLKILELKGIRGKMVQEILCTLPNLTSISAPWIQDVDILEDPRPWICSGLTKLSVCIDLVKKETSQQMIFERLGDLKSLETLVLSKVESRGRNHRPMDKVEFLSFRLDHGLDSLRELRKLSCLGVLELFQELSVEEVRWMMENWPRLRHVFGSLHPNGSVDQTLRWILIDGMVAPRIDCGVSIL